MTHPLGLNLTDPMVSPTGKVISRAAGSVDGVTKNGIAAFDPATRALLWTTYGNGNRHPCQFRVDAVRQGDPENGSTESLGRPIGHVYER